MATYEGRLELTWTNKDRRLLAPEDGSYEWVSAEDYRVAEVRLLHDVSTVGEIGRDRAGDNLLIKGDALNALTSLSHLPEFTSQYLGKVRLCYIDPPFNTGQAFTHYDARARPLATRSRPGSRPQRAGPGGRALAGHRSGNLAGSAPAD